jgi:hypothetical protein
MSEGWIKLHRALADHPRFRDGAWLQVWIKCLLSATHQTYKTVFNGKIFELKPGQFITSRKSLAQDTRLNESRVERILKTLEIEQQIEQVGGATSRLITVTKWADYQESEQGSEQRANTKRTASEQRSNTNKNGKNDKNGKKEEKTSIVQVDADLLPSAGPDPVNLQATKDTLRAAVACALLENPNFAIAWDAFLQMRKSIKFPAGPLAQERILHKLEAYPVETAIAMVDESTMNSWRGVFPLKESNHGNHGTHPVGGRSAKAAREYPEELAL